jgi:hypothetical protein
MSVPQFTADASLCRSDRRARLGFEAAAVVGRDRVLPALVGRWHIPFTNCEVECIEACTRFCRPTGWDCCAWQTRCAVSCDGRVVLTNY